jgi:hypothetical protein
MTHTKATSIEPPWRLRYQLRREDIVAFEFLPRELIGKEKLWLVGPVLACGASAGFFQDWLKTWLPWDPTQGLGQVFSVMIAIGLGYALGAVLLTARAHRRIARATLPAHPISVVADRDRLNVADEAGTRAFAWQDLRVSLAASHVFLCPAPREAVIIPLRAFKDEEDMRRFAAFAEAMGRETEGPNASETQSLNKEGTP